MDNPDLKVENRRMGRRWGIVLAVAVVLAGVGLPFYFNWWDHKNCSDSGGTWSAADDKCVEAAGANIPDTEKAKHDQPR